MAGDPVVDARRLATLRDTGATDSPALGAFDDLAELASTRLGAPVSLVSLVDDDRQVLAGRAGVDGPWSHVRETPLSRSFCQHVVRADAPLLVSDASEEPLLRDNLAVRDLHVRAYAGIPLRVDGATLGALCVVDTAPREWPPEAVGALTELAGVVEARLAGARRAGDALTGPLDGAAAGRVDGDVFLAVCGRDATACAERLRAAVAAEPAPVSAARVRAALPGALARDELILLFAPLRRVADATLAGLEAHLRWNSGSLGHVADAAWLPVAAQSGALVPIGEWALREACARFAAWRRDGRVAEDVALVVPFCTSQLGPASLPDVVADACAAAGLPPETLHVRVPAGAPMTPGRRETLDRLAAVGVRLIGPDEDGIVAGEPARAGEALRA